MSRSAGPGSPTWFMCAAQRRARQWPDPYPPGHDTITRTGRTRPRRRRGAVGVRSLHTSHEYRCECGHVGWSNHRGVLDYPLE